MYMNRKSKCKSWKKEIILFELSQILYRWKLYIASEKIYICVCEQKIENQNWNNSNYPKPCIVGNYILQEEKEKYECWNKKSKYKNQNNSNYPKLCTVEIIYRKKKKKNVCV